MDRDKLNTRMMQLAEMLERDAASTLDQKGATYWFEGVEYADRDKVDWALGQLDRAAALRARAQETSHGQG